MGAVRFLACWIGLVAACSFAQQPCPLPPFVKPAPPEKNIFSDAQEADLGEIMAEGLARDLIVVDDDALSAHLREVGDQLTSYLPPNHFRFQFFLMELPEANAFSFPGGRIYVSRKLVALARNDDELAGTLAHELGHIVTHQAAVADTLRFRRVLGVTQVTDRADIAAKYHRLLDTWRLKPMPPSNEIEDDQFVADNVALFAMARAGFALHAFPDVFDRLEQTHGKTGSWLTDFFGGTNPGQRRLREILKTVSAMPPTCKGSSSSGQTDDFQRWQTELIAYNINVRIESLPGLLYKQPLALPLRPDITNLRFSPNGNYVAAQDDGGIHILSRDPLAELFFIEAPDAYAASFTADSKSVVFYTPALRVEVWDLAGHSRSSVHELAQRTSCWQTELSPDGSRLACFNADSSLALLDVASGESVVTKKNFYQLDLLDVSFLLFLRAIDPGWRFVSLGFSPDGRYFLAGSHSTTFAFDLSEKHEIYLPASVRSLLHNQFAFLGPDRLVVVDEHSPQKSPVVRFPTGERLDELPLGSSAHARPAAHGDYLLVGPLKERPLGAMDMHKHEIHIAFTQDAGDMYDSWALHEQKSGEVAITEVGTKKSGGRLQLKQSRLGALRAISVSDDFQRLAVSTRTRGAVWDLAHNVRVQYTRGFNGAWFDADGSLYADFPKLAPQERAIVRVASLGGIGAVYSLEKQLGQQQGPYFAQQKPVHEGRPYEKEWTIELHDIRSNSTVWTHRFTHGLPAMTWNAAAGTVLLATSVSSNSLPDELKLSPELKRKAYADDYFLELLDLRKDAVIGKLLVQTAKRSFRISDAFSDGDWVVVQVSGGRVLLYALSTGEEKGHAFGTDPVLSAASGKFAVTAAPNQVDVYGLAEVGLRREFKFPTAVAYKKFSPDGKRLFVLTRDQTAYVIGLTAEGSSQEL